MEVINIFLMIKYRYFEYFIMLSIFINSLILALYNYSDRDSITQYNKTLDIIGLVLTGIFTIECLLKILGLGFILHKKAYLRDGWNFIDFFVVISG
jgi:hypothetical protein